MKKYLFIFSLFQRTAKQIQKFWDNELSKKKKKVTNDKVKRMRMGTGGGPYIRSPSPSPSDDVLEKFVDIEIPTIDSDYFLLEHSDSDNGNIILF